MRTVFGYKQQFFLKIWLIPVFGMFLVMLRSTSQIVTVGLIFLGVQAFIHIYYASKRIVLTDSGIEQFILGNLRFRHVNWEEILEAHVRVANSDGRPSNALQSMDLSSTMKWLTARSAGETIRLIVDNNQPLVIDLKEIKDSSALLQILKERVRFA